MVDLLLLLLLVVMLVVLLLLATREEATVEVLDDVDADDDDEQDEELVWAFFDCCSIRDNFDVDISTIAMVMHARPSNATGSLALVVLENLVA